MSEESTPLEIPCTECGASNASGARQCWLCGHMLVADDSPPSNVVVNKSAPSEAGQSPFAAGPLRRAAEQRMTFRLSSLMLTVTLIAVCLGVARLSLALGIWLVIFATPAFLRTAFAATRRRSEGRPMGIGDKVAAFIGSLAIVLATAVSFSIAAFVTCWVGAFGGQAVGEATGASGYEPIVFGAIAGTVIGILLGVVVAVLLLRWLWPFERKPRNV